MMIGQSATQITDLRIWRDEKLGQLWRLSYNEGYGETVISFPDTAALGDFLSERLGLTLVEEPKTLPTVCLTYTYNVLDALDEEAAEAFGAS
jgi:hypothetical protein